MEGKDSRRDKSRCNDDGSCRRLNECRDTKPKQKCLELVVGHVLHCGLQSTGRALFQAVPHQAHAVEEHRKSAEQSQQVKETHNLS